MYVVSLQQLSPNQNPSLKLSVQTRCVSNSDCIKSVLDNKYALKSLAVQKKIQVIFCLFIYSFVSLFILELIC